MLYCHLYSLLASHQEHQNLQKSTTRTLVLMASFQESLGNLVPEYQTILDF